MPSPKAIQQMARWVAICAILRSPHPKGQPWTTGRIADRLGLSVDTVGRELDRLTSMGAPIEGMAADTRSGWAIGEWDLEGAVWAQVKQYLGENHEN